MKSSWNPVKKYNGRKKYWMQQDNRDAIWLSFLNAMRWAGVNLLTYAQVNDLPSIIIPYLHSGTAMYVGGDYGEIKLYCKPTDNGMQISITSVYSPLGQAALQGVTRNSMKRLPLVKIKSMSDTEKHVVIYDDKNAIQYGKLVARSILETYKTRAKHTLDYLFRTSEYVSDVLIHMFGTDSGESEYNAILCDPVSYVNCEVDMTGRPLEGIVLDMGKAIENIAKAQLT